MRQLSLLTLLIGITATAAFCQKVTLDGYVFEELNRGYLNEVKVTVLEKSGVYVGETLSDIDGHFKIDVEPNKEYNVQYEKKIFQTMTDPLSTVGKKAGDKVYLKRQLERQPGYLLEVTLADKRIMESVNVDAINGARIEIFNLTANREELVIDSAKSPVFSQTLLQGYHYVIMIRKKGYFTRRMDAHVNIDGCYLCMEGFGTVTPGMVSNLTSARDNKIGTLLANVDLTRIDTTQNIVFQNIYYAYNSAELTDEATKELDKVSSLLQNNGALIVELGSHTDSRGSAGSNLQLSQARAESAVKYILGSAMIDKSRIKAKGYGESKLANRCEDGMPCSEAEHVRNRRTELKIIGFTIDPNEGKSLGEIVRAEEMMKFIKAGESQKEYKAPEMTPSVSGVNSGVQAPSEPIKPNMSAKNPEIPRNVPQGEPKSKVTPTTPTPSKPPALTIRQLETGEPPASYSTGSTPQKAMPSTAAQTMKQLESGNAPMPKVDRPSAAVVTPAKPIVVAQPKPKMENVKVNVSPIEASFSGYKVELFTSSAVLTAESEELQNIGNTILSEIATEKLKNGQNSYLVGTFLNWSETERFLEKVQTQYNKARIVEYFNGKRIGQ
jgi:outer membrane protein OmpA-like peptidoglycan-associated protein